MSDWQWDSHPQHIRPVGDPDLLAMPPAMSTRRTTGTSSPSCVTHAGADWLASASVFPTSVHALWRHRPASPSVLPCGTAFDVVSAAPLVGRRLLDRLWTTGPGSGPVAVHRDRSFSSPLRAPRSASPPCSTGASGVIFGTGRRTRGPGNRLKRSPCCSATASGTP